MQATWIFILGEKGKKIANNLYIYWSDCIFSSFMYCMGKEDEICSLFSGVHYEKYGKSLDPLYSKIEVV